MDSLLQDVRHALRSLSSSRGYALLAVLCLSVGIGANTMVFSIVNALLLRPLPFDAPERLVLVNETRRGDRLEISPTSYPNYRDWRESGRGLGEMAALRPRRLTLADGQDPEYLSAAYVTWNLFPMLGVRPTLGRGLRSEDDRPGAAPVVVLGDALWRQRYAASPSILGRSLLVDGAPHTVVGIMPPHFAFPRHQRLWLPLAPAEHDRPRERRSLAVYARLADGVTLEQADARMSAIGRELAARHPDANRGWGVTVRPMSAFVPERQRAMLTAMVGAVGFVLLIACANVAHLMLARGLARRREVAIRRALGATDGRIRRQLVTESLVIGAISVAPGLAGASLGLERVLAAVPAEAHLYGVSLSIDGRVVVFTIAVALLTSLLFGLAPSLQAVRATLRAALASGGHEGGAAPSHGRASRALVVAEVALSIVLAVGAALFLRSFLNLLGDDGGFDTRPVLTLGFDMPGDRYTSAEAISRRVEDVVARLEALPGALAAAASDLAPLRGGGARAVAIVEGREDVPEDPASGPRVLYGGVTARFFDALDVPLLRGRSFTELEAATRSAVAVVNQTMARRFWPGRDPVAQRFRLGDDPGGTSFFVIGVSRDILTWDVSNRPLPGAYLPYPYVAARDPQVIIRAAGDPTRLAPPARAAVRAADPALSVFDVRSMSEVHRLIFWRNRLLTDIFLSFGAIAVLLAAIGAYGVLSYAAQRRTREIGVRMALGADRRDVVWLIVRQGATPVLAGLALGVPGALAVTRLMRGLFHEVSPSDPLSYGAVALLVAAIGVLSSYGPARRAASVDPIRSLRE